MSKDTIYREDAIKATWQEPTYTDPLNVLTEVRDRIESIPSTDRPQGKTISVDVLKEILSDVKEAHRNNSEAEAVIADVWGEVVDMLKGADDE